MLSQAFKLIIASRDDRIPPDFCEACQDVVLPTGDHVTPTATADINTSNMKRFSEVKKKFRSLRTTSRPGPQVIQQLTTRAAGLFIWAETVMRFIGRGDPQHQLSLIISGESLDDQHNVNHLYRQIATNALANIRGGDVVQPLLGV
ncbi:hypothetical protein SERLA73DRAFT_185850 [Serpula lacrymans var. lacrymans S7.3]|uniref:Uncharacterized protein n=2 Tax=Serpula lacrymans var. lacrymans TaxID=341189 RepID=F8Q6H2_SERL3|nr:uncharacterized protein SERLADRAFT_474592 [Serpula lacrymans var. lacrymans S7.9]EGN96210.1 hypothetical protein SERLA73DRAFT_185850 [Serpula lacrymans var. lacrymans S7.3]EGO21750.1 hypothetical protein SERLADRAFT_474592 [Serpula lacrymans var. lacrymans S7.9]